MEKQIAKLNKEEITSNMWDGAFGCHVLAVAPDGSAHSIHWMENNRQWNPWPTGWLTIGIPALDPDGSGQELEDAEYLLNDLGRKEEAKTLMEAEDIGWVEAVERLAPEDWKANRENGYDWLADAFLAACNGEGSDLNDPSPWGYEYDEGMPEDIDPPAEFEWEVRDTLGSGTARGIYSGPHLGKGRQGDENESV